MPEVHADPFAVQVGIVPHTPLLHVRPEQQSLDAVHDDPVLAQARVQTPDTQVDPAQQSAFAAQVWPASRHTHTPPVQSIWPQQSLADEHAEPAS